MSNNLKRSVCNALSVILVLEYLATYCTYTRQKSGAMPSATGSVGTINRTTFDAAATVDLLCAPSVSDSLQRCGNQFRGILGRNACNKVLRSTAVHDRALILSAPPSSFPSRVYKYSRV